MTTMTIEVQNATEARKIAAVLRLMKSVERVSIHKDESFERIPGLPYTQEERVASVRRGEEDIRAGRIVTVEELRAKHPRP